MRGSVEATGAPNRRARRALLLVVAAFVVPLVIAVTLYWSGWRPVGTVNHGELVEPPLSLASVRLVGLDGEPLVLDPTVGRWTLLISSTGDCDPLCREVLYKTRQVRWAVGKDLSRVGRLLLLTGEAEETFVEWLSGQHPQLTLARAASDLPFPQDASVGLVDPMGNLMMHYPPGADPTGMLKDLKRLLKLSKSG